MKARTGPRGRKRFVPPSTRSRGARDLESVAAVVAHLRAEYPEAECALRFHSPFQLLVATILSAQCTDERVNQVTPGLFARFGDPRSMASARLPEIEALIRPTGFFRNKARSIQGMAAALVERHGGSVPSDMAELTALPGVGRKTANCIRGTAFDLPAMVVDTHVSRLARRLGWTKHDDAVKAERDLMALLPERDWTFGSHALILHGRRICKSQRPRCRACVLGPELCPSYDPEAPA